MGPYMAQKIIIKILINHHKSKERLTPLVFQHLRFRQDSRPLFLPAGRPALLTVEIDRNLSWGGVDGVGGGGRGHALH